MLQLLRYRREYNNVKYSREQRTKNTFKCFLMIQMKESKSFLSTKTGLEDCIPNQRRENITTSKNKILNWYYRETKTIPISQNLPIQRIGYSLNRDTQHRKKRTCEERTHRWRRSIIAMRLPRRIRRRRRSVRRRRWVLVALSLTHLEKYC